MALHFRSEEFEARIGAVRQALRRRGLGALLLFSQESMYYLTGYDTFGFCFFQCMYVGDDGRIALLTRAPDLRQARHTSLVEDVRVWSDDIGTHPSVALRDLLAEFGAGAGRLGVEFDSYGLNAHHAHALEATLAGFCTLEDASDLVRRLRAVKSGAELDYVARAAELADQAFEAGLARIRPGANEGDILAAMQGAVFAGGGDYPGNEFIIGSGRDALLCRYFSGRRRLEPVDQLTLEFAGVYRHYHAALMRTVLIGEPHPEHLRMHRACVTALQDCRAALGPGKPLREVFEAHARALDREGYRAHRMNACGYSLGATFSPTWMDWPMLHAKADTLAAPDMVFFIHIILMDSDNERAMTLGQTVRVTESGCEPLSRLPLDPVIIG